MEPQRKAIYSICRVRPNSSIRSGTVNCCDSTTCCSFITIRRIREPGFRFLLTPLFSYYVRARRAVCGRAEVLARRDDRLLAAVLQESQRRFDLGPHVAGRELSHRVVGL